jgi:hypothetical protein
MLFVTPPQCDRQGAVHSLPFQFDAGSGLDA